MLLHFRSFNSSQPNTLRKQAMKSDKDIFAKHYDNCIIGSGLSGSVIAQQYSTMNQSSLIIEKRSHIGGNCYDEIDGETGIRISLYGAHLFHTNSERVWRFVNQFGEWVKYEHKVLGLVEGKYVPIPVNIDTVNTLFDLNISNEKEMQEWLKKEQVVFNENRAVREAKDSDIRKRWLYSCRRKVV